MSILIIDDSTDSQILLKSLLNSAGYKDIVVAGSCVDAFKFIETENSSDRESRKIDLILLDILMPGIDGIEACRLMQSVESLQDVPIILVTATEEVKYLQMALDAGALDYVNKPVKKLVLLTRVRSALRLKQELDCRKRLEKEVLELKRKIEERSN